MSEAVAAFSVYSKMESKSAKKKSNSKSSNAKKGAAGKAKVNAGKIQSKTMADRCPRRKTQSNVPGKPGTKNKGIKKNINAKAMTNGVNSKPKVRPTGGTTRTKKVSINGNDQSDDLAKMVEELYGEGKSLKKDQKKLKNEFETFLERHLAEDSCEGTGNDCSESGSSDEFSDEYTVSGSSDSLSEGSYSGDSFSEGSFTDASFSDESGTNNDVSDSENIPNQKEVAQKRSNGTAKRKSTDSSKAGKTSKNSASIAKKSKSTTTTKSASAVPNSRRSTNTKVVPVVTAESSSGVTSKMPKMPVPVVSKIKVEHLSPPTNIVKMDSVSEGERLFRWLLNPLDLNQFFAKYWEQNCCLIERKQPKYFSNLMSFETVDQMLLKKHVEFTKNIDITSYKNGVRKTLNPEGRALSPAVWDFYGQGCSIRLLNPQTYIPSLFSLNTTLQEYFHCMVGANVYLTPPNSQGFAPHYDDIEAFVLQIEGRKRWKLYKPRNLAETLPRVSSKNFTQNELGELILEKVLHPGDILYFPRGIVHQACTEPGHHSLHITLSVYQKQSYVDLFEQIFPQIIKTAVETNINARAGLPLHTWQHLGFARNDSDTRERDEFISKVTELLGTCLSNANMNAIVDAAVDQLAKKYQREALPPEILPAERVRTIYGSRSQPNERGECICDYNITVLTNVRLLRANIMRLVHEEGKYRIYYYVDNSKEYCEYEPSFIEINSSEVKSVKFLIESYPEYVGVSQIPLKSDEKKIELVTALWEHGLLMTEKPFK